MSEEEKKCGVCKQNTYKYKCPRCEARTCSLECCRAHKLETGCTGQRDRTKFVKKEDFSEHELLSDYRFLEEQALLIDTAQRSDPNIGSNIGRSGYFENLRKFLYSEFKIGLRLMPEKSSRHRLNYTKFNRFNKIVSWSLEFIFHLDDSIVQESNTRATKQLKFNTSKFIFSSKETIRNVLKKFYENNKRNLFEENKNNNENGNSSSRLCLYSSFSKVFEEGDFNELNVLILENDYQIKKKYFSQIGMDDTLEDVLKGRTIIEYPTFYLVKTMHLNDYLIKADVNNKEEKSNGFNEETSKTSLDDKEEGECDEDDETDAEINYQNKKLKST